jgi:uncharacterized membrane protein YidH (DUF202 family)
LGKLREHPLISTGIGVLAGATVITLAQIHIAQEPRWLEKMNNFEHFVFHLALVMVGLIVGASGLAAFLYCALRMREPRNRHEVMAGTLNEEREARLMSGHLLTIAVVALAVVTVILAKRHMIEPLWLTNVTPFQHFLIHVCLVAGGVILGASGLAAFVWALFKLLNAYLGRFGARQAKDDETSSLLVN